MNKKGFTLVELMVVILIVGILAAVAIPLMRGRIDSAKWSEARAAMGTIATGLRAYFSERQNWNGCDNIEQDLGITEADLDGTYFEYDCYNFGNLGFTDVNGPAFSVTCTAGNSSKSDAPTSPASVTLTVNNEGEVVWTEVQ
jgi:prepilin-type N-terminal cleavage/methylation domain-containing protein